MHRIAAAVASILLLSAAPLRAGALATPPDTASAVFAGGCFWGVEGVFEHVKGVLSATSGYAGGSVSAPSYMLVSSGTTGHAESVRVVYDPTQVTYDELLQVFFAVAHDPTQLNRQGPDVGTQYRSIVFYQDSVQRQHALAYVAELTKRKAFRAPIVTQIAPLEAFYPAEAYHQHFMARHPDYPYIVYNDAPKIKALQQKFPALFREPPKG
ncbi:MAG TPA: peptide-methionine (S)-S-oxide reductase MsrA [Gemmatimonadales bacterium]|nr:peptide-methionine (S)-S-oxide reductase MsrA [Gemmatimonadales bacterium]